VLPPCLCGNFSSLSVP